MSNKVIMRSGRDRIRYTVTFEVLLMAMLIPAGSIFFDKSIASIGVLGVALSVKAMLMNLVYNWIFDSIDARYGRISSQRSHLGRIVHAAGFEFSLVITSLPIYIWWLDLTIFQALLTDLVVTSMVVFYTYLFTLVYDRLFPLQPDRAIA
ncbi:MAG: PACE efflux transporter [Pseudomonadota bacterium]